MSWNGSVFARVEGGEELRRALRKLETEVLEEMGEAIPVEAEALLKLANAGVPREAGALARTATVSTGETKTKRIAVAAYLSKYAAAAHEGIHWGVFRQGTAGFKWYTKARDAFAQGYAERIAARLRALLGGG